MAPLSNYKDYTKGFHDDNMKTIAMTNNNDIT